MSAQVSLQAAQMPMVSDMLVQTTRGTEAPALAAYVRSAGFRARANALIGFAPVDTLVFARLYEYGDAIDWHYDQNLTVGRKYTAILHVHTPACNTARLEFRDPCSGDVHRPAQTSGTLVAYPGDEVFHRVTPQLTRDCDRFVVVMGFNETRRRSFAQHAMAALDATFRRWVPY